MVLCTGPYHGKAKKGHNEATATQQKHFLPIGERTPEYIIMVLVHRNRLSVRQWQKQKRKNATCVEHVMGQLRSQTLSEKGPFGVAVYFLYCSQSPCFHSSVFPSWSLLQGKSQHKSSREFQFGEPTPVCRGVCPPSLASRGTCGSAQRSGVRQAEMMCSNECLFSHHFILYFSPLKNAIELSAGTHSDLDQNQPTRQHSLVRAKPCLSPPEKMSVSLISRDH